MQMLLGLILAIVGWILALLAGAGVMTETAEVKPLVVGGTLILSLVLVFGSHAVWAF